MVRIKKIVLATLVAFALAAGGMAVGAGAEQIASSKGGRADAARESASVPTQPEELQQVAGSKGDQARAGRESS